MMGPDNSQKEHTKRKLSHENEIRQTTSKKCHQSKHDRSSNGTSKQITKSDCTTCISDFSDVIYISDESDQSCNPDETHRFHEISHQSVLETQENTGGNNIANSSPYSSENVNPYISSTSKQICNTLSSNQNKLLQEQTYTLNPPQSSLENRDNTGAGIAYSPMSVKTGSKTQSQYTNQNSTKQSSKQTSVKRKTFVGEEYQKIMQVLVRQRGLATPESLVGCEVAGVGKFDDIVYIKDGESSHPICRFFQIKNIKRITMDELFQTDLETEPKGRFILLRCFKDYCKMKKHATFKDCKFGDVTFITKRDIEFKPEKEINLLKEERWEKGVQCWNEQDRKSKKYSLIKENIYLHNQEFVQALHKETENQQLINEFIENCRIIIRYNNIKHYKKITKECKRTDGDKTDLRYITTPGMNKTYSIVKNIISSYKNVSSNELLKHTGKLVGPDIKLMPYFESFLKIKANPKYSTKNISEITILTTKGVDKTALASLLIQEDIEKDECLYFAGINAKKYKVNINSEELKKTKEQYMNLKSLQLNENEMNEFINKIRIVVDYPHLDQLKELTFNEVFGHQLNQNENEDILQDFIIHQEVKELGKIKEFITCQEWRSKINEYTTRMESSKAKGITEFTMNKLLQQVTNDISFEDEVLFKNIVIFLNQKQKLILNLLVENLKFCSIVVFNTLKNKKVDHNFFTLENLVRAPLIIQSLKTNDSCPIILIYDKKSSLNDSEIKDTTRKIAEALTNSSNKIILLSNRDGWNFAEDFSKEYISEEYSFGFKNLNVESKSNVLSKPIMFQEKIVSLGGLLNNDDAFATYVIDERFLWEIISRKNEMICIGKPVDIDSEVYDEQYFVPRSAFKKVVTIGSIKDLLKKYLFIALYNTNTNDVDSLTMTLVQGGIDKTEIRLWKSSSEKSIERTNGLVFISIDDYKSISADRRLKVHSYPRFLLMFKDFNLYFVHAYSITNSSDVSAVDNINNFEDTKIDEKYIVNNDIFILAADSGSGKSTSLISYAKKLKHEDSNTWVVRVELRKFFNEKRKEKFGEWSDITKSENVIKVVSSMALGDDFEDLFYSRLLQIGMTKEMKTNFKLVLLLDGYNEINEAFQDITRYLINTLVENLNYYQIWITTQVNKKIKLETDLNSPALFLRDLSNEDQVELMARYWETKYRTQFPTKKYNQSDLREDAKIGLIKLHESINDSTVSSFSVVCLNVIMLADYLIARNRKVEQCIDLPSLYDEFFMKRLTLCAKISQLNSENVEVAKSKSFLINMRDIHEEVAARYYFKLYLKPENYKHLPKMDKLDRFIQTRIVRGLCLTTTYNKEQSKDVILKIGVLTWKDDELDFYHESFAQFFLSEFLLKNVDNGVVQDVLVNFVLVNRDLKLCRKFLDKSLQNIFLDQNTREYNSLDPFEVKILKKVTRTINLTKTILLGQVFIEEKLLYTLMLFLGMQTLGDLKNFVRNIKEKFQLVNIDMNNQDLFKKAGKKNTKKSNSWENLAKMIIHQSQTGRNEGSKLPGH